MTVTERTFVDVDDLIDELLAEHGPDTPPPVLAKKLRCRMEETGRLDDWLTANIEPFLTSTVKRRIRARFKSTRRREFNAAVTAHNNGDSGLLETFLKWDERTGTVDGCTKPVAEFTADDHRFVANRFQTSGQTALMLAAFHRTLAKLVGPGRTCDVIDETQYVDAHQRFLRRHSNIG